MNSAQNPLIFSKMLERTLSECLDVVEILLMVHLVFFLGPVHCSRDLQVINLCKFFFKTGSYGTIHTFKNHFVTMFLVFSNKRYPNRF